MKKLLKHIGSLGIVGFLYFLFSYGSYSYCIDTDNILNALCYLGCYILFPLFVIYLGWNYRIFRWYSVCAMSIVIIAASATYYLNAETTDRDLSSYLAGDSEFVQIAACILPEKQDVVSGEYISYLQRKSNSGYEIIQLHIAYDPDTYSRIAVNTKNRIEHLQSIFSESLFQESLLEISDEVFLDGRIYTCFLISTKNGYYAAGYSGCSNCYCDSWFFFTHEYLSFMSIEDALKYCE